MPAGLFIQAVRNRNLILANKQSVAKRYVVTFEAYCRQGTAHLDYGIREEEISRIINEEVERMPRQMKAIYLLDAGDNLSQQAIANKMNLSLSAVKTQLGRATYRIKKRITELLWIVLLSSIITYTLSSFSPSKYSMYLFTKLNPHHHVNES